MPASPTLVRPTSSQATIYRRLMLGKITPRTREAYAGDLRDFARFLVPTQTFLNKKMKRKRRS